MLRLNVLSCSNTKSVNLVETSVSFFCLYCLGLRLPFGRVEPSIGGEGLRLYEAPSPPIAASTLRPQKIWGYAGGKLRFDFDFRKN